MIYFKNGLALQVSLPSLQGIFCVVGHRNSVDRVGSLCIRQRFHLVPGYSRYLRGFLDMGLEFNLQGGLQMDFVGFGVGPICHHLLAF
jgi:hypothetical protein